MLLRSIIIWFLILICAILNGTLRTGALIPGLGEVWGHIVSTLMLLLVVFIVSFFFIRWLNPADRTDTWLIGILWLLLTIGFEFIAGHYLFKTSWEKLLADYDISKGRIWIVVLLACLTAPFLTANFRGPLNR